MTRRILFRWRSRGIAGRRLRRRSARPGHQAPPGAGQATAQKASAPSACRCHAHQPALKEIADTLTAEAAERLRRDRRQRRQRSRPREPGQGLHRQEGGTTLTLRLESRRTGDPGSQCGRHTRVHGRHRLHRGAESRPHRHRQLRRRTRGAGHRSHRRQGQSGHRRLS